MDNVVRRCPPLLFLQDPIGMHRNGQSSRLGHSCVATGTGRAKPDSKSSSQELGDPAREYPFRLEEAPVRRFRGRCRFFRSTSHRLFYSSVVQDPSADDEETQDGFANCHLERERCGRSEHAASAEDFVCSKRRKSANVDAEQPAQYEQTPPTFGERLNQATT